VRSASAREDLALRLRAELEDLPAQEDALLAEMIAQHGTLFDCASYGLAPHSVG